MPSKPRILIIACNIMKDEFESANHTGSVEIEYLEQSLHRTPGKMPAAIQEKIDKANGFDYIVLGYGACGNGIAGVKARQQPLIIPRAHDCITFFLGSMKAHLAHHEKCPGTYYLNKGWIEEKKDPLGVLDEYTEKYGRKTAEWVIQESFKNYKRMVMVTTGTYDPAQYRARAMADAEYVKLAYEEIEGSTEFIMKIVRGPRKSDEFLTLKPGEEVTSQVFLELIGCAPSPMQ